ncbi:MAG TPA: hypothetical protein VGL03_04815 [Thermoanaerobaculia bacterium]|jgi:hypothetical protein
MKRSKDAGSTKRSAPGGGLAILAILVSLAVAAVLLLLYAAAAHRLLSGPQLRSWINTEPESTWLDYDEATSLLPGRLQIKNLRIRGSDRNVQWIIRLAEAQVRYSVADLFARRFHVLRVGGRGLSFRLRNKLDPKDPLKPPMSLLPPIPGFADPPLRSEKPERIDEGVGNPWAIEVQNLSVEGLEEIWIDVYRFRGNARLHGGFFLRPGLLARVGPATIPVAGGQVGIGEDSIAAGLAGKIAASIDAYDPRLVRGSAVWDKISGDLKLEGRVESLRFLNYYLRPSPEPRLAGGSGPVRVAVHVERGLARGVVEASARQGEARYAEATLRGDADLAMRIASWRVERGPLELAGSRIALSAVSSSGGDESRQWWGRFEVPSGNIHAGALTARVDTKCRDARPLFTLFRTKLPRWTRGLLSLEGLSATATVTLGPSLARVRDLDAAGGRFRIQGEYVLKGKDRRGIFLIGTGPLNVGVGIRGDATSVRLIGTHRWFEKERSESYGSTIEASR